MNTWRNASLAVTAVAVLALTTACGQEQGTTTQSVGAAKPAAVPEDGGYGADASAGTDTGAEAEPAGQLGVSETAKLGDVVTDSKGFTLYRFDNDTASPPASNGAEACAPTWPVVAAEGAEAPAGVDPTLIGEVTRGDGSKQLTIGDWPMYRYAKDTKPGDINGQGVGGKWFAAAPDGKKAVAAAKAADLPGLSVRKDPKLGEIIVDKRGMTVYRFNKDSAWPMKSACVGACLDKWPVVAPLKKSDTKGIIQKGFVTFDRPDGIKQQSINCWPVYTFSGDKKPGDTNGQGVGGTWFAVSPDSKLVGAPK